MAFFDTPPGIFYDLPEGLGFGVLQTGQPVPSFPIPADLSCQELRIPCNVLRKAHSSPNLGSILTDELGKRFYFVEDTGFRDQSAGGFVDFERVYCSLPAYHDEFESWAWNVPGLQNNTTRYVTGNGFVAPVYSAGILRPQVTVPVLTRLATSYYVIDPATNTIVDSNPEPNPSVPTSYLTIPVTSRVPFGSAMYQALLIQTSDGDGAKIVPLIGTNTIPSFATWRGWGNAGVEVCVESTQAKRWKGAIWQLTTRWAQVFDHT